MKLTELPQYRKHAKRAAEALAILARYGLAGWIRERDPEFLKGLFKSKQNEELAGLPRDARIRMALAELGTTYIKLGQVLSTRADLVGQELAAELTKLQSDTPADPDEVVRSIVESELGKPLEELYAEFDTSAMASASVGQVHVARLFDGSDVVVKVQHDGIEERVHADLDLLQMFAALAEEHSEDLSRLQPKALAAEFRRTLLGELDYGLELRNTERFALSFQDDPGIRFASVFADLSTRRVLTMERLDGYSVAHTDRLDRDGVDKHAVAWQGANVYLEMVFRDGLYHADPHPGNIFVLEGGVVGLLDCGMVGRISEDLREEFEGLLIAVIDKDEESLLRGITQVAKMPPDLDRNALKGDASDFLDTYAAGAIEDFDLSGALTEFTDIVRRHHIMLTPPISMLVKVLVMLEGTAKLLDPQFSLGELMQPYYSKAVKRRLDPKRLLRRARSAYQDWDRLVRELPARTSQILARIDEGSFNVNLEHRRLDAVANRAVLGLLTAALLVASAMLWSNDVAPLVRGVSFFGAAGYFLSLVLGWRLLRAIRASGDLESRG